MAEGNSQGQPGPYSYQKDGKTHASLPTKMLQGIQQCPYYNEMLKDCAAQGIQILQNILMQDPQAHILTPQQYLQNVKDGKMPPMRNHNLLKAMVHAMTGQSNQPKFVMMQFPTLQRPSRADTLAPNHHK